LNGYTDIIYIQYIRIYVPYQGLVNVNIPAKKAGPILKTALTDSRQIHYLQENNSICTGGPNTKKKALPVRWISLLFNIQQLAMNNQATINSISKIM
jgi:hypothetical protein